MTIQERKKYSYKGRRLPAIILYEEHQEAMNVIEPYWKNIMNRKYAFADVQRHLLLQEKERILKEQEEQEKIAS